MQKQTYKYKKSAIYHGYKVINKRQCVLQRADSTAAVGVYCVQQQQDELVDNKWQPSAAAAAGRHPTL